MPFFEIYIQAFFVIMLMMTSLWVVSIFLKNASIVDPFWGFGFVLVCFFYFVNTGESEIRKIILMTLVAIWGLRLSIYLAWRNIGKGEDFRYRQFRIKYGENRYWWVSFFQTFLLQGVLMWLISAPLLGAQLYGTNNTVNILDALGIIFWIIGFAFEAGGDFQLAKFRTDPINKGKLLTKGFWRYTRHPNYFGDSAVWWGYGLLCLGAGGYIQVMGSLLMTALIINVSGVALLEKSLKDTKPEYKDYMHKTNTFIPWFPKK